MVTRGGAGMLTDVNGQLVATSYGLKFRVFVGFRPILSDPTYKVN